MHVRKLGEPSYASTQFHPWSVKKKTASSGSRMVSRPQVLYCTAAEEESGAVSSRQETLYLSEESFCWTDLLILTSPLKPYGGPTTRVHSVASAAMTGLTLLAKSYSLVPSTLFLVLKYSCPIQQHGTCGVASPVHLNLRLELKRTVSYWNVPLPPSGATENYISAVYQCFYR